jgi:hypothetical protein
LFHRLFEFVIGILRIRIKAWKHWVWSVCRVSATGITLPSRITGRASSCSFEHVISEIINVRARIDTGRNWQRLLAILLVTRIDMHSVIGWGSLRLLFRWTQEAVVSHILNRIETARDPAVHYLWVFVTQINFSSRLSVETWWIRFR